MRYLTFSLLTVLFVGCGLSELDVADHVEKARAGDKGAVRALVRDLGAGERDTFIASYKALIELGSFARPFLMQGLSSEDPDIFEGCATALGNIGSREAVPVLIDMLGNKKPRLYAAAWALGEIGDESAILPLVGVLNSGNQSLRKAAVRALIKIGPVVEKDVNKLLSSADPIAQRAAIRVVGEIRGKRSVSDLLSIKGVNRDAAVWAMGRTGDGRVLGSVLAALADENWMVRREAAEALGSLEDSRAEPALTGALDDGETVVREWAARSLETVSGKQVLYLDETGEMVPPYNLYR